MSEKCKRIRCEINGQNYYWLIGKDFVMIKVPYENRADMAAEKDAMTKLGDDITAALKELNKEE